MVIEPETNIPTPVLTNEIFPADSTLWFVRDLMIVAITTPILYWLLNCTLYFLVIPLFFIYVGMVSPQFVAKIMIILQFSAFLL